jgi:hypothetical protein
MKTGCVALVLCLNVGVDPPDVIKISPCARMECWVGESCLPVYLVRVGCENSAGEGYPVVECLIIITCSLSQAPVERAVSINACKCCVNVCVHMILGLFLIS